MTRLVHQVDGGAIAIGPMAYLNVASSRFTDGQSAYGGAVAIQAGVGQFADCTFQNLQAGSSGGVLWAGSGSQMTVTSSVFEANKAVHFGGVAFVDTQATVSFIDGKANFSSAMQGGALVVLGHSNVSVTNFTITGSAASVQAGAIYVFDSSLTVQASTIERSIAPLGGAILDASLNWSNITVTNSTLIQNGLPAADGTNLSPFFARLAQYGSVYQSTERGGAIVQLCRQSHCIINLRNTKLSENSAEEGNSQASPHLTLATHCFGPP